MDSAAASRTASPSGVHGRDYCRCCRGCSSNIRINGGSAKTSLTLPTANICHRGRMVWRAEGGVRRVQGVHGRRVHISGVKGEEQWRSICKATRGRRGRANATDDVGDNPSRC